MTDEHQFNDPVLNRDESTRLWWLRRAFRVVLYERDEDVSTADVLCATLVALGASVIGVIISVAPLVAIEGPQSAAESATAGMSVEGFVTTLLLFPVFVLVVGSPLMVVVAILKHFRGDRS